MNKTVTVNLGGTTFNIEEEAFVILKSYLDRIQINFVGDPGESEIMQDIEIRLAELFTERLDERRNVVVRQHVEEVIAVMGKPEDYSMEGSTAADASEADNVRHKRRRVFRDADDKIVAGVCSGLSYYLGWDPILLRAGFLLFGLISGGTAFIAYLVIWAIVPEARTTAEKLQMRGEPVNVDSISRFVNTEARKAADSVNKWANKGFPTGMRPAAASRAISGAGKALVKIAAILMILYGFAMFMAVLSVVVFADFTVLGDSQIPFETLQQLVFRDSGHFWLLSSGALLMILVPSVALLYTGFRLLFGSPRRIRGLGWTLAGMFFAGMIMASLGGLYLGREFSEDAEMKEMRELEIGPADTLVVNILPDSIFTGRGDFEHDDFLDLVHMDEELNYYGSPLTLEFEESATSSYALRIERESNGPGNRRAGQLVSNISYSWSLEGDTLNLQSWFTTPAADPFRGQEVEVTVLVPKGRQVRFGKNTQSICWTCPPADEVRMMWNNEWLISGPVVAPAKRQTSPADTSSVIIE